MKKVLLTIVSVLLLGACAHYNGKIKSLNRQVVKCENAKNTQVIDNTTWKKHWIDLVKNEDVHNFHIQTTDYTLSPQDKKTLANIAIFHNQYPKVKIRFLGYSVSDYTRRRVIENINSWFSARNISSQFLSFITVSYGEKFYKNYSEEISGLSVFEVFPDGFYFTSEQIVKATALKGEVKNSDGKGVFAIITFPNHEHGNVATDPDSGRFEVSNLSHGKHVIEVVSPSYEKKSINLTVRGGDNLLTIKLLSYIDSIKAEKY